MMDASDARYMTPEEERELCKTPAGPHLLTPLDYALLHAGRTVTCTNCGMELGERPHLPTRDD